MSISPPTATATATTGANSTTLRSQTYWCHECDMSVLLLQPTYSTSVPTTAFPPVCPHCCRHDFLEQMDSVTSPPPPPPPPPNSTSNPPSFFEPFTPLDPTSPSDDTFLLESPYLHRLIHHLMTTDNNFPPNQTNPTPPRYNSPASKHAIDSLTRITVDSDFLDLDPSLVCAVCKDQFVMSSEAKILPCKHTYHVDCIVPWLELNNSCPVCRHRLPSESDERNKNEVVQGREGENFIGAARLGELLDDEQDLFGFTSTLRNVVRRQQYSNGNGNGIDDEHNSNEANWNWRVQWDNEVLLTSTQIGEVESVGVVGGNGDHVGRANSVETVSSCLRWPVEGGPSGSGNGSGDGEIGVGMNSGGSDEGGFCEVLRCGEF